MHLNKLRHSHSVAIKMEEIGKLLNLDEKDINQLFILGLNHDIGYQFIKEHEKHNKIGGEILKKSGYKYWKEVYYHGEIDKEYNSLFLDILNMADLQIDKDGNDIGFDERLKDIKERHTEEIYNKCSKLVTDLKKKYKKIL